VTGASAVPESSGCNSIFVSGNYMPSRKRMRIGDRDVSTLPRTSRAPFPEGNGFSPAYPILVIARRGNVKHACSRSAMFRPAIYRGNKANMQPTPKRARSFFIGGSGTNLSAM